MMQLPTETLSVDEAGQVLGVCRSTAYKAVATGVLPVIRLGRRLRVSRRVLDELLRGGGKHGEGA